MAAVLIAEDEALLLSAIADFLRRRGFTVMEARSAAEALAVLKTEATVDVVFSDVNMPGGMDGFELAHWMRQHRPGVPVMLTSAKVRKVTRTTAANDEVMNFLPKPYDPSCVERTIRRLVSEAGSARSACG